MTIALVYGGRSTEHEVSIASAVTMHYFLEQAGYRVLLIAISLDGQWYLQPGRVDKTIDTTKTIHAVPGIGFYVQDTKLDIDAVFATTHGYGGEDGNLQGLCMLCRIPLCGCDTVSSALGMHKNLASALFMQEGIPTVPTLLLDKNQLKQVDYEVLLQHARSKFGNDLFVKPENSGSSVGVSVLKDCDVRALQQAVELACRYSERVLVQTFIHPLTEVETAVLATQDQGLVVAGPGLVIDPAKEKVGFLSYEHKYGHLDTAYIKIPSGLERETEEQIRNYARKAFLAIKGDGYARIDFFVSENRIFLNEINTSPGLTDKSHYPALLASVGYDLSAVCKHLVADALQRNEQEKLRIYTPPGS